MEAQPREIDAVQDLADMAILDRDKRPVGRVDDIEFSDSNPPVLVALLSGAPALSNRFRGRVGPWMRGLYRRLHDEKDAEPLRITLEQVAHINSSVDLNVTRNDLGIDRLDRFIVDVIIGKIPGADHAPE